MIKHFTSIANLRKCKQFGICKLCFIDVILVSPFQVLGLNISLGVFLQDDGWTFSF